MNIKPGGCAVTRCAGHPFHFRADVIIADRSCPAHHRGQRCDAVCVRTPVCGRGFPRRLYSFQFNVSLSNGNPLNSNLMIPYNMPNIFNDFETNSGGSSLKMAGLGAHQPGDALFRNQALGYRTHRKLSRPGELSPCDPSLYAFSGSVLSLQHRYGFENNYDGGNVIFHQRRSQLTVISPGRYTTTTFRTWRRTGFSGSIPNWQSLQFNLSQYGGQTVRFRFRMGSDSSTTGISWFLDNPLAERGGPKTGYMHGTVIPFPRHLPAKLW